MAQYEVTYKKLALKQLDKLERSGRKTDMERVDRFVEEVAGHPRHGIGKSEQLRHKLVETRSRKVNAGDRFVYEIYEDEKKVLVTQVLGHYEDR